MILIRRSEAGEVYYKYLASGQLNEEPFETWSSSKIFAMATAGGKMREEGVSKLFLHKVSLLSILGRDIT